MSFELPPLPLVAQLSIGGLLALLLATVLLGVWLALGASRLAVSLQDGALVVRAPFYGRAIRFEEIRAAEVAVVDVTRDPFVPGPRVNGVALPGLRIGHFRLAKGAVAHVVLTTSTTAVAVPLVDGSVWLLGVRDPERLRQTLLRALDDA